MKRTLSLILAAILLASSVVSCGGNPDSGTESSAAETTAPETTAHETVSTETEAHETEASDYSYDTTLITENGIAKSHIVLLDGSSDFEKTAANELAYHIKLVSGADVAITNTVQADSLPIIIATPDSLPELETLFPEDLAWLRVLSEENPENGRSLHWGDDGFAIRVHDGKIYIFGTTALGAMNGTYDFIEENLDLIWIGATEEGIIYTATPTITTLKTDYREKSPFSVNSTVSGSYHAETYCLRNKQYRTVHPYGSDANVKDHVLSSPIYDSSITEYWDTSREGTHLTYAQSGQVNFWSELTADTVAARVIEKLDSFSDEERPVLYNVCMQDIESPCVYPEMTEPFEYAPGQFIDPSDGTYLSTVYFTFINRVARKVGEKYPDVYINTLAYMWATESPKCEIEDNVSVWFCTYNEDVTQDNFDITAAQNNVGDGPKEAKALKNWLTEHPDTVMHIYNYYFCHYVQGWYERPIWYRMQTDMQLYAEAGMLGTSTCLAPAEGNTGRYSWQSLNYAYTFTYDEGYRMNILTLWLYHKLLWDPYEDVDALITKFCDKVYGDVSDYMKEYYNLLERSWAEGAEMIPLEFNAEIKLHLDQQYYYNFFIDFTLDDGTRFLDAVKDVLTKAYEAADDKAKEFIRWPYEVYQDWEKILERP